MILRRIDYSAVLPSAGTTVTKENLLLYTLTKVRKKITYQIYWKIAVTTMFGLIDHDQEDRVSMRVQNFINESAQSMYPTRVRWKIGNLHACNT